jgi:hypothetical protein
MGDATGEGVCHKRRLVGPPSIDCGLADTGAGRNVFYCEICEPIFSLLQEFKGAVQDRLAGTLTARPSWGAFDCATLVTNLYLHAHGLMLA